MWLWSFVVFVFDVVDVVDDVVDVVDDVIDVVVDVDVDDVGAGRFFFLPVPI